MPHVNRDFVRVGHLVREALLASAPPPTCNLPVILWEDLQRTARQRDRALAQCWHLAARRLEQEFRVDLVRLQRRLAEVLAAQEAAEPATAVPSLAEICRDLLALTEEFALVECDFEADTIAVTTRPLTLDGVPLGPFQIRLAWHQLRDRAPYRVVALEPNPALANESVTHPHVSDEVLCEGDGRRAIEAALAAGRLLDFFTIVGQLLATYAPGRAYVELEQWHGLPCSDCGAHVLENQRSSCADCQEAVCDDCSRLCESCYRTLCAGCATSCSRCDQTCCQNCLVTCSTCGAVVCSDCRIDQHCEDCHEQELETSAEAAGSEPPAAAVQPDGLGQARLPAGPRTQ